MSFVGIDVLPLPDPVAPAKAVLGQPIPNAKFKGFGGELFTGFVVALGVGGRGEPTFELRYSLH